MEIRINRPDGVFRHQGRPVTLEIATKSISVTDYLYIKGVRLDGRRLFIIIDGQWGRFVDDFVGGAMHADFHLKLDLGLLRTPLSEQGVMVSIKNFHPKSNGDHELEIALEDWMNSQRG